MARVTVVRHQSGPVLKVLDGKDTFDEWFAKYGSNSYARDELKTVSAKVLESSDL